MAAFGLLAMTLLRPSGYGGQAGSPCRRVINGEILRCVQNDVFWGEVKYGAGSVDIDIAFIYHL